MARAATPVTVRETPAAITLDNGIVTLTFDKKYACINSIVYHPAPGQSLELGDGGRAAVYWDANALPDKLPPDRPDKATPKAGYFQPFQALNNIKVSATPDMADIAIDAGPSEWFNFHARFHYVLRRGDSGFYVYAHLDHGPGMPAVNDSQVRNVIRAENKGKIFTDEIIDDDRKGPPPSSARLSTPQDATYRLADGTSYTKYQMSQFVSRFSAYGFAGHGVGLWYAWPSTESCNGGPFKQELTVQIDNVMQAMFQGQHFGAPGVHLADNEKWSKLYGPVFIYINHGGDSDSLWRDARKQAAVQQSHWPYAWLDNPDYPLKRGSADGRLLLHTDAGAAPAADSWVILDADEPTEQDADFEMRSRGYRFFTRTDSQGRFHIEKLRPGRYTLFASGDNQFEPFKKTGITIDAAAPVHLGDLDWPAITHGRTLWQIGTADRSTAEFHDGSQPIYRSYDAFRNYFTAFPHDVTFTIGQSKEAADWEFAQWGWYNEKPDWTIRFNLAAGDLPAKGAATLTLGIASAQTSNVLVNVNGKQVAKIPLPKTGGAGYRSGAQDSMYLVKYVPFDSALLRPGQNEITLGQARMQKFTPDLLARELRPKNDIMYDAIRLEVQPASP
ncbi:MAG TPA: polysaccharide lyase family protein [Phycisphaerae bacterium]|nr:polysaccharide lyase family protein [Phycisphaerae bacterium]